MQIRTTPPSAALAAAPAPRPEAGDLPRDTVTLGEPGPDLTVSRLRVSNPFPRPGETVSFRFAVANIGTADAGPFNVSFRTDEGAPLTTRVPQGLAAGTAGTFRVDGIAMPGGRLSYGVAVEADSDREVAELRENNNTARVYLQAPPEPPPPPLPPPPIPPRP